MVSSKDLQNAYLDLYRIMREYLWDVDTLEDLADVEVEIFTTFIDRPKVRNAIFKLSRDISPSFEDDEELQKSFNILKELVDSDEEQFAELQSTELP